MIIARVENGVTKFSPKRQKTPKNSKIKLDQEQQFSVHSAGGEFSFFGRGKTNFFWGGVCFQNWLASDHPGAYTSMPQPLFGAKDVCYTEKKVTK